MTPLKVFITGITGYVGGAFFDQWFSKGNVRNDFSIRALVRSAEVAENSIRPLGVEPVIGSLDDSDLLIRECANADIVLDFADSDHLPSVKAILKGLSEPRQKGGRARPILIHTSGTGVLTDSAFGYYASEDIYYDNDVQKLSTLGIEQLHRVMDLEMLSPSLVGRVDIYIVAPPMIYGYGTGPVNKNTIQIPRLVKASLKTGQAVQVGEGLNVWNKVHVRDLSRFYILLLKRSLQEPQIVGREVDNQGNTLPELPKNQDAYWFVEDGEFTWGSIAQSVAREFVRLGINDSGKVLSILPEGEEGVFGPKSAGSSLGTNSRCRAVKAREILGWEPELHDLEGYIAQEVERQFKEGKYRE
ncbi:hypothetical protein BGZ81_009573 [Podila clonocystis]|nr:hypothetical protein BGZ81_009573 [Podila clonocystis]